MLDSKNTAQILALADALRKNDSWCGETHLQKAMFFLRERCEVPLDFEFVLYKHGPYSFDFHDSLSVLFAHGLIENESQPPYGPRIKLTESGINFLAAHQADLDDGQEKIQTVARWFGSKGVMDLEKLATALWTRKHFPDADDQKRAEEIHEIKPHVSMDQAMTALQQLDQMQEA